MDGSRGTATSGSVGEACFEWHGEVLVLDAAKAVHWPREGVVFVADVHVGKAAAYRRLGAPVPEAVTARDLDRLSALLDRTRARRLVVLGDLFHSAAAWSGEVLASVREWRAKRRALTLQLVRGNHDARAGAPPRELGIECLAEGLRVGPWRLVHDPARRGSFSDPVLSGHVHPAVRLRRPTGGMRLPCFWFGDSLGILPAFGSFTGCRVIRPVTGDRVFVVGTDRVMEVGAGASGESSVAS